MGWHAGNSDNRPHPVGELLPNACGFCDMHGNVWELCNDLFGEDYYSKSPVNDPPEAGRRTIPRLAKSHDLTILRVESKNDFDTTIPHP